MNFDSRSLSIGLGLLAVAATVVLTRVPSRTVKLNYRPSLDSLVNADVGDTLCVPGVDFSAAERTAIIAISDSCHFCLDSRDFLRLLAEAANRASMPIYCLADIAPTQSKLLRSNVRLLPVAGSHVGLYRLPSVAMVNQHGVITSLRTGLVRAAEANSAIQGLLKGTGNRTAGFTTVTVAEVKHQKADSVQIIDPRETIPVTYRPDLPIINMPASEIGIRALYELTPAKTIVVDCRYTSGLRCQDAISTFLAKGFQDVRGLNLPKLRASPSCPPEATRD